MPVTVIIKSVEKEAVYKGQVYTQTALVNLEDGEKIQFFDPNMLVRREMIGERVSMDLKLLLPSSEDNFSISNSGEYGIVQNTEISQWGADITGSVQGASKNSDEPIVVDVGIGTVKIPNKTQVYHAIEDGIIRESNTIEFITSRIDIAGVE
jgi:hypothetical protein